MDFMKKYRLVNNVLGWIAFAIAAFTYCSTIEPTASFWDCPEFITTGYKLEIGHPPGAPFFMLTANFFSHFASDPSQVARMVNTMSALLSATCILFLFWSITHLARKLLYKDGIVTSWTQTILVMGCGLVGALAYTWSDTFWFSAVEGEVYAYSSMFTALVFWLILKWEDCADQPHSDRWLVLIFYLTGLSIGVHLLNLLCLPAIVLVYYFKKWKNVTAKGSIIALVISMVLVAAVLYGVVPGIVKVGGWFEWFFVNTCGMSFNTGFIIYIILLIAVVIWAIYESYQMADRKRIVISAVLSVALLGIPFYGEGVGSIILGLVVMAALAWLLFYRKGDHYVVKPRFINTGLLCALMLMIGYSSYAVIVIRSTANPTMDQNSPEDVFSLRYYLGREQYGSRPLFYGQAYSSQIRYDEQGNPMRSKGSSIIKRHEKADPSEPDRYEVVGDNGEYMFAENMLFPRMYSDKDADKYDSWLGGIKGHTVVGTYPNGESYTVVMPTQWENFRFFLSYQLNFMYWRYFMWNFAGRQNDIQGFGEYEHGNWITGIAPLDNARLGDQSKLPDELKNNKGHNVFYCLPLILGLIGLFFQAYRGKKGIEQFWVVFFLFFMTGIAIVLYLNQTPAQPRERDYAYAGSFYAFAIWIGLGVAALAKGLERLKLGETPSAVLASLVCLLVPVQMVSQTWDDHDRSGRYTCRDFGANYLNSLQQKDAQGRPVHPIIYTNGDNDTFPLWYNQEVEGVRTDARVCNLSYLQTDWYIDQMKRPAYDSPALPIDFKRLEYVENGQHEFVYVQPELKSQLLELKKSNPGLDPFDLKFIIDNFVRNPQIGIIPTDSAIVKIDKAAVLRSGMKCTDSIPDHMTIRFNRRAVYKSELMMYEMLENCNWTRPIYISLTVGPENHAGLTPYLIQEGLASRVTPFVTNNDVVDTQRMYDNLMHKFRFGGLDKPGLYLDETVMRMCYTHRQTFATLIMALLKEGKKQQALQALQYCKKVLPSYNVPYDVMSVGFDYDNGLFEIPEAWRQVGRPQESERILLAMGKNLRQYMDWYNSLGGRIVSYGRDIERNFIFLQSVCTGLERCHSKKAPEYRTYLERIFNSPAGRILVQRQQEREQQAQQQMQMPASGSVLPQ